MKQYRISKKNSDIGWVYRIQRKFLFLWVDTLIQPFNQFDYSSHVETIKNLIQEKENFLKRKKEGNSVIIKL